MIVKGMGLSPSGKATAFDAVITLVRIQLALLYRSEELMKKELKQIEHLDIVAAALLILSLVIGIINLAFGVKIGKYGIDLGNAIAEGVESSTDVKEASHNIIENMSLVSAEFLDSAYAMLKVSGVVAFVNLGCGIALLFRDFPKTIVNAINKRKQEPPKENE